MTPDERRQRIYELTEADKDFQAMLAEYLSAKAWFEKHIRWIPAKLRSRLLSYPGMGHFLYHQLLNLVCQHMRFPDEE